MTFGPITINRPGAGATVGIMGPRGVSGTPGTPGAPGAQGPAVFTPITAWVSGETYSPATATSAASYVSIGGSSYACTTVHTSGVFVTDLADGLWEPVGSKGDKGDPGTPGSIWYSGSGAPAAAVGINGDYFFRTDTGDVLLKVSGSWSAITNIKGVAGSTIYNGAGAPANTVGANGDFYIDTTNTRIYGPKASGAWPASSTSLIGSGNGNVNPSGAFTVGDLVVAGTTDGKVIQDGGVSLVSLARVAWKPIGDAAYTMLATDRTVAATVAFTAARTWTLPAAASVPPGTSIRILDQAGAISAATPLTLAVATPASGQPADTMNGAGSATFMAPNTDFLITSDGVGHWTYGIQGIARGGTGATTAAVALANLGGVSAAALAAALGTVAQQSDLNVVQQTSLYTGLLIAALRGVPTGIVDGILDPFSSTADINTSSSSNYFFTSSAGTITTGSTSAPGVISTQAQAIYDSQYDNAAFKGTNAFDGSSTTFWASALSGGAAVNAAYIGQDFGKAASVASINYVPVTNGSNSFTSGSFQYSDDKSNWTTFATSTTLNTSQTINVPSGTGQHRYWRLLVTSATSAQPAIAELTMNGTITMAGGSMVLQSATLASAVASPSAARVLVQVDGTSAAFTLNTDLLAFFSRDGGTTFTQGTLSLVQAMPDGTTIYDTGYFSVAGQPAGNSTMTYKLTTPTAKAIVLTGVSMQVKP